MPCRFCRIRRLPVMRGTGFAFFNTVNLVNSGFRSVISMTGMPPQTNPRQASFETDRDASLSPYTLLVPIRNDVRLIIWVVIYGTRQTYSSRRGG